MQNILKLIYFIFLYLFSYCNISSFSEETFKILPVFRLKQTIYVYP